MGVVEVLSTIVDVWWVDSFRVLDLDAFAA